MDQGTIDQHRNGKDVLVCRVWKVLVCMTFVWIGIGLLVGGIIGAVAITYYIGSGMFRNF